MSLIIQNTIIFATVAWGLLSHIVPAAANTDSGMSPNLDMAAHFRSVLNMLNHSTKSDTLGSRPRSSLLEDTAEECSAHLNAWAADPLSPWSIQMLDAMSKIPEGLLSGHMTSLGDFDECLATRGEVEIAGVPSTFKGQYCTAYLAPAALCGGEAAAAEARTAALAQYKKSTAATQAGAGRSAKSEIIFSLGMPGGAVCVPNKCNQVDLQNVLVAASNSTGVCILLAQCQAGDPHKLRAGDIAMITILAIIGALMCIGTAVDLSLPKSPNSKPLQALIAFSFYTNTKKWLNTSGGADNLGCIHGIRFLSTCWVVLCHTWSTWIGKVWNLKDLVMTYEDWTIYPILNGTVSVDTFFTLAGILAAYSILKVLDKTKGKLNVPMLYLHRYLRLTPTYAILVGIMATWFEFVRRGPHTGAFGESCRHNWWHNLLYINNLIKYDDSDPAHSICHGESWYLGNDMQFFLVSPLLVWPLWKWPVFGGLIMGGFTLASVLVPFVVTYVYELNATAVLISGNDVKEYNDKSYAKPWMRFGPYIVGLWAGYLLYLIRKRATPIKLPALVVVLGWATSTAMALAIIFGAMRFFDPAVEYERLNAAFYAGLHRFGWGLVISWIVLACTLGYGGIINKFLSWKVFIPLGRLSFCVYLISMWLQALYYTSARQHITYDLYTGINHFFGHMILSLLVSFVACMAFESPFIALEKLIFSEETKSPAKLKGTVTEKGEPGAEPVNLQEVDNMDYMEDEAHKPSAPSPSNNDKV